MILERKTVLRPATRHSKIQRRNKDEDNADYLVE